MSLSDDVTVLMTMWTELNCITENRMIHVMTSGLLLSAWTCKWWTSINVTLRHGASRFTAHTHAVSVQSSHSTSLIDTTNRLHGSSLLDGRPVHHDSRYNKSLVRLFTTRQKTSSSWQQMTASDGTATRFITRYPVLEWYPVLTRHFCMTSLCRTLIVDSNTTSYVS